MWKAACKDAGVNCSFEIQSEDKGEVLTLGLEHVRARHQYEITSQLVESLSKSIRKM